MFAFGSETPVEVTARADGEQYGREHENADRHGDDGPVHVERVQQPDEVVRHHLRLKPRLSLSVVLYTCRVVNARTGSTRYVREVTVYDGGSV